MMAIADINSILSRSFRNDRISKISWEIGSIDKGVDYNALRALCGTT